MLVTNISTILKRCHQEHNSRDEFGIITSNNSTSHGYNQPDNQIPLKYRYKTQLTSREKEMKVMKKKNKKCFYHVQGAGQPYPDVLPLRPPLKVYT